MLMLKCCLIVAMIIYTNSGEELFMLEELKKEIIIMINSITSEAVAKRIYYIIQSYLSAINKRKSDVN